MFYLIIHLLKLINTGEFKDLEKDYISILNNPESIMHAIKVLKMYSITVRNNILIAHSLQVRLLDQHRICMERPT